MNIRYEIHDQPRTRLEDRAGCVYLSYIYIHINLKVSTCLRTYLTSASLGPPRCNLIVPPPLLLLLRLATQLFPTQLTFHFISFQSASCANAIFFFFFHRAHTSRFPREFCRRRRRSDSATFCWNKKFCKQASGSDFPSLFFFFFFFFARDVL